MKRNFDFTNLKCILESLTAEQEGALYCLLDALISLIDDDLEGMF